MSKRPFKKHGKKVRFLKNCFFPALFSWNICWTVAFLLSRDFLVEETARHLE